MAVTFSYVVVAVWLWRCGLVSILTRSKMSTSGKLVPTKAAAVDFRLWYHHTLAVTNTSNIHLAQKRTQTVPATRQPG